MLTPRRGRRLVRASLLALTLAVTGAFCSPASAAPTPPPKGSVACPTYLPFCIIVAEQPGTSGSDTQQVSSRKPTSECRMPSTGQVVPCYDPQMGWFNSSSGCWFTAVSPQPGPQDPAWEGHYPNGAIYQMTCPGAGGTGGGWVWRATPPAGFGAAGITPAQLAERAVELLGLKGPQIGMAPPAGTTGLVGVPVWMWTTVTPTTWGPVTATASVPGLSVTATGQAQRIVWSMGDGTSVTCTGPGTPYTPSLGGRTSPTCGHIYQRSSAAQPGAKYPITATTTWQVTWVGGGQNGVLTVTRTSTATVSVGELQVLVT